MKRSYGRRVLIALDRFGNALTRGDCDLTISQQNAIRAAQGKPLACLICRLLDWIMPDHCADSLRDAKLPPRTL